MQIKPYTYLIKFKITDQVYYGVRSKNVRLGLTPEQDLMVKYFTSCNPLKKLIKQYGVEQFEWEIRRIFDDVDHASNWEKTVLRRCKVVKDPRWFNQSDFKYIKPTPEGLKKISECHKGKSKSAEQRKKMSESAKKHVKTPEHCANLSKALTGLNIGEKSPLYGIPRTEEQKRHHSEIMKGCPSWMSDEDKKQLSERMKGENNPGKNKSEETRKKLSESLSGENHPNFGKHSSEETRQKMSKSHKGKIRSEEHCRHLSESQKGKKKDPSRVVKGESSGSAKLTEEKVLEIRKKHSMGNISQKELANEYGVTGVTICRILSRKIWKHI